MTVTALLVSHDGARWLPAVLSGLASQQVPPDQVVAVDTSEGAECSELLVAALPPAAVVSARPETTFADAVRSGLAHSDLLGSRTADWVWLLHDDSTPAPDALAELLAAAAAHPDADVIGPKLREWPSLRRLLELGVTISGTGRRETGLERGEYDQGQHDEIRAVLAVNTAGMLVRRSVLDALGGFDAALPVLGADLDFGWRAAWAGHQTIVAPRAVVFHAEAGDLGLRPSALIGRRLHLQRRRAALYTLLVNSPSRALFFQTIRLALGTVLRVLGYLVIRSPREAFDELAALFSVYVRPGRIRAARQVRAATRTADPDRVKALLAPAWLPYRHGLDFVSDFVAAVILEAQDVAERRRLAAGAEAARDEDAPAAGAGRWLRSPTTLLALLVVLLMLVAARAAVLEPVWGAVVAAPAATGDWWRLLRESWHPVSQGSAAPAPAYLPLLAVPAAVLGGPTRAVTLVMLIAAPLGFWGAWRLLRALGRTLRPDGLSPWLLLWGSTTYALLPAASGAWGAGRLDTVLAAAVLPWLVRSALGFADPFADRRWRAGWRCGVWLTVMTALTPTAWVLAAVLVVVAVLALGLTRAAGGHPSVWAPPLISLGLPVALLASWVVPLVLDGPRSGLLAPAGGVVSHVPRLGLLTGVLAAQAAPGWGGLGLLALAAVALIPSARRIGPLLAWLVALAGALTGFVLAAVRLPLPTGLTQPSVDLVVVVVLGAAVVAVVVGAARFSGGSQQRLLSVLGLVVLAVIPVGWLGWWVLGGHEAAPVRATDGVPGYLVTASAQGPSHAVLTLDGSAAEGLRYTLVRGGAVTIGEPEILRLTGSDDRLTGAAADLVAGSHRAVGDLAGLGVQSSSCALPPMVTSPLCWTPRKGWRRPVPPTRQPGPGGSACPSATAPLPHSPRFPAWA